MPTLAMARVAFDTAVTEGIAQALKLAGQAPDLRHPPAGCRFAPRCSAARDACWREDQPLRRVAGAHEAACVLVEHGGARG